MVQTVVYYGFSRPDGYHAPHGIFGHVLGTSYTWEITQHEVKWGPGFAPLGDGFLFGGSLPGYGQSGLFYSDGSGEVRLALDADDFAISAPGSLVPWAGDVLFQPDSFTDFRLFRTDGINPPEVFIDAKVGNLLPVGNLLYATVNGNLAVYDTAGHSQTLLDHSSNPFGIHGITYQFEFGGDIYFRASDSGNLSNQFFRYDPGDDSITDTGVYRDDGGDDVRFFGHNVGEHQFYFWAPATGAGIEMFVSDGTADGTHMVADINPRGNSLGASNGYARDMMMIGDELIFFATNGSADGIEAYATDGTEAGTVRLSGTGTGVGPLSLPNGSTHMARVGDTVWFSAIDSVSGQAELYVTDGTRAGTHSLDGIVPITGLGFEAIGVVGDSLIFSMQNGQNSGTIWESDGTAEGTRLISDPDPNGSNGGNPVSAAAIFDLSIDNIPAPQIEGGIGDDRLEGSFLNEHFSGNAGNDVILARGGDDTLDGGVGADRLNGGAGDDQLFGAGGRDVLGGAAGNDRLFGGWGNDRLFGGWGNDGLFGGTGNDHLNGGAGADRLFGGPGSDWASYAGARAGVKVSLLNPAVNTGEAAGDRYASIENLVGSGHGDTLVGDATANVLSGGGGNDHLNGGAGDDRLFGAVGGDVLGGAGGDDHLFGGAGNDRLFGGVGNDHLNGGTGNDRLGGAGGNDVLGGAAGADHLFGGAGNDRLFGGVGNDHLNGGTGNDRLAGGGGNDVLGGAAGNDWMFGGAGSDRLFGGGGADHITGNAGNDYMAGGAGADVFHLHAGAGHDVVGDFSLAGKDRLFVSQALTGGVTDADRVVADDATVTGDGVLFAFDGGATLLLAGLTDTTGLADQILITA